MVIPRRVRQTITIYVLSLVACLWWYLETNIALFVFAFLALIVIGAWDVKNDIGSIRSAKKDPRGLTSIVGDAKGKDGVLLLVLSSSPFLLTAYAIAKEGALIPSDAYIVDPDPVGWVLFAGVACAFTLWVTRPAEKIFWAVAMLLFAAHSLRSMLLRTLSEPEHFRSIARALSVATSAASFALLLSGVYLFRHLRSR